MNIQFLLKKIGFREPTKEEQERMDRFIHLRSWIRWDEHTPGFKEPKFLCGFGFHKWGELQETGIMNRHYRGIRDEDMYQTKVFTQTCRHCPVQKTVYKKEAYLAK